MGSAKFTTQKFINRANLIHNNKYIYSLVEYKAAKQKVKIICRVHGEFLQNPHHHLDGKGCPKCGTETRKSKISSNTAEFISKALKVHKNYYKYDSVDYISSKEKVTIECPSHGKFKQVPSSHLSGKGCPDCGKNKKTFKSISEMCEEEKNKSHWLYHIELTRNSDGFVFQKIGVCGGRNLSIRFPPSRYSDYSFKIVHMIEGRKEDILLTEINILDEMSQIGARYKLKEKLMGFRGWSECFYLDDYDPIDWFVE